MFRYPDICELVQAGRDWSAAGTASPDSRGELSRAQNESMHFVPVRKFVRHERRSVVNTEMSPNRLSLKAEITFAKFA